MLDHAVGLWFQLVEEKQQKQLDALAIEKAQLENEKLRAETKAAGRRFYHSAAFYTALTALGTLIYSQQSGWFDAQKKNIEAEKKLLVIETKELEAQKEQQQDRIRMMEAKMAELKSERRGLTNQIISLTEERDEIREAKEKFEKEAHRLAGSDADARQYLSELESLQERRRVQDLRFDLTKDRLRDFQQVLHSHLKKLQADVDTLSRFSTAQTTSANQLGDIVSDMAQLDQLSSTSLAEIALFSTNANNLLSPSPPTNLRLSMQ